MKLGLGSDFFVYFRFHFQKAQWHSTAKNIWDRYFRLVSKIHRIYQVTYDSSNLQRSIKVEFRDNVVIWLLWAFFVHVSPLLQ